MQSLLKRFCYPGPGINQLINACFEIIGRYNVFLFKVILLLFLCYRNLGYVRNDILGQFGKRVTFRRNMIYFFQVPNLTRDRIRIWGQVRNKSLFRATSL